MATLIGWHDTDTIDRRARLVRGTSENGYRVTRTPTGCWLYQITTYPGNGSAEPGWQVIRCRELNEAAVEGTEDALWLSRWRDAQ